MERRSEPRPIQADTDLVVIPDNPPNPARRCATTGRAGGRAQRDRVGASLIARAFLLMSACSPALRRTAGPVEFAPVAGQDPPVRCAGLPQRQSLQNGASLVSLTGAWTVVDVVGEPSFPSVNPTGAWDADGRHLYITGENALVRFDVETGAVVASTPLPLRFRPTRMRATAELVAVHGMDRPGTGAWTVGPQLDRRFTWMARPSALSSGADPKLWDKAFLPERGPEEIPGGVRYWAPSLDAFVLNRLFFNGDSRTTLVRWNQPDLDLGRATGNGFSPDGRHLWVTRRDALEVFSLPIGSAPVTVAKLTGKFQHVALSEGATHVATTRIVCPSEGCEAGSTTHLEIGSLPGFVVDRSLELPSFIPAGFSARTTWVIGLSSTEIVGGWRGTLVGRDGRVLFFGDKIEAVSGRAVGALPRRLQPSHRSADLGELAARRPRARGTRDRAVSRWLDSCRRATGTKGRDRRPRGLFRGDTLCDRVLRDGKLRIDHDGLKHVDNPRDRSRGRSRALASPSERGSWSDLRRRILGD
jgi:hypothetical protein